MSAALRVMARIATHGDTVRTRPTRQRDKDKEDLMKRQAMVSVLGTFTFGFALLGLVGCSGDDSDGATPASDAGPGTKDGSIASQDGAANDANTNDSASPTTDGGHDAGCDKAPSLHPAGSAGPYCPFIDGGEGANCAADQLCCLAEQTDLLNGSCQSASTCPTTTAFVFQCSGPSNCGGGATTDGGVDGGDAGATDAAAAPSMLCCGIGPAPTVDGTCPAADLETSLSSTVCATSCNGLGDGGANALVICDTTTGECPAGMTCTPFRTHGSELGYCQ
jgi:hypothetical protein